jgi:hypothetical protein
VAIIVDFSSEANPVDDTAGLSRDRIMKAAALYLGVKAELMKFEGVSEEFARQRAEDARDAYIRACIVGRL